MRITPAIELEHRCSRLQSAMREAGLDAIIIVQSADLYYFTGTIQAGALYLPSAGQPLYLVRRDHLRARMESGLKEVIAVTSPADIPKFLPSMVITHLNLSAWNLMFCQWQYLNDIKKSFRLHRCSMFQSLSEKQG